MTQVTQKLSDALAQRASATRAQLVSPSRNARMTVVVGRLLALAFLICFATGLYSHFLQEPLPWMTFPTRPIELYRWTQGIHLASGMASIPLLLAKLWTVYPLLFAWPPVRSLTQLFERASIAVLISAALLEVAIGLVNTYQWYPWPFSFRRAHYGLAWVIVGSLAVHIAMKLPIIVGHWTRSRSRAADLDAEAGDTSEGTQTHER